MLMWSATNDNTSGGGRSLKVIRQNRGAVGAEIEAPHCWRDGYGEEV